MAAQHRFDVREAFDEIALEHGIEPEQLWNAVQEYEPIEVGENVGSVLTFVCSDPTIEMRLPAGHDGRFNDVVLLDWQRRFLRQTFGITGVIELSDSMSVDELPVVIVEKPGTDFIEHVGRRAPFDKMELADLARQLGATIEELHRRGLHHRDIRPRNLVRGRRGWVLDHPRPVPVEECRWGPEHDLPAFRDVWGCASILAFAAIGRTVVDPETMSDEVRHLIETMPLGSDLAGFRGVLLKTMAMELSELRARAAR
jgi:serine/threonine protein kinase